MAAICGKRTLATAPRRHRPRRAPLRRLGVDLPPELSSSSSTGGASTTTASRTPASSYRLTSAGAVRPTSRRCASGHRGGTTPSTSTTKTSRTSSATPPPSSGTARRADVSLIRCEVADRVATITLDDPDRRNAMTSTWSTRSWPRSTAWRRTTAWARSRHRRPAGLLRGADLSHLGSRSRRACATSTRASSAWAAAPLPTLAAVNGAAVGAGMNLALVLRPAAGRPPGPSSTRGSCSSALHPGGGHTWMFHVSRAAGRGGARSLFGEVLDGPGRALRPRVALRRRRRAGWPRPPRWPAAPPACRGALPPGQGHPGGDARRPDPCRGGRPRARGAALVVGPARVRRTAEGACGRRSPAADPTGSEVGACRVLGVEQEVGDEVQQRGPLLSSRCSTVCANSAFVGTRPNIPR